MCRIIFNFYVYIIYVVYVVNGLIFELNHDEYFEKMHEMIVENGLTINLMHLSMYDWCNT